MPLQHSLLVGRYAPVLAAIALAASVASAATPGCAPAGAKVLEASGSSRVYSSNGSYYGCLGARQTRLGALSGTPAAPATRVERFALAAPYAAVDSVQMGVDNLASRVSLVDLRSGATVASAAAAKPPARAESFVTVSAMALNANGVLAWVARIGAIGQSQPNYELHLLEHRRDQTVAAGTIPIVALALTRSRVSWNEDHVGGRHWLPLWRGPERSPATGIRSSRRPEGG
jgi:hypothetical protein